jgi:plasmid stabilization system protein ParE
MKVIYTDQSLDSLEESVQFLLEELGLPMKEVLKIKTKLLDRAEGLVSNPLIGQSEEYLDHLDKDYRRLVEGHFKIIYRIQGEFIYITDFFDTRQNPLNMRG